MTNTAAIGQFSAAFRKDFSELMRWRRDVRSFQDTPVDPAALERCLDAFKLAPSVSLTQPWRLVDIKSNGARKAVLENFKNFNASALSGADGETAQGFATQKLKGLEAAPVQYAVFSDSAATEGHMLDLSSIPQVLDYSVAAAIMQFWLALRVEGIGMGWVSRFDPAQLQADLDIAQSWKLVGYLCIGYPTADSTEPDLQTRGYETRTAELELLAR
ncbi:5,6-dimethylbenzimidazole synthase [Celeribacter sp. PS-C1]|uniref:5,6-dimethylbenzimidazole synthase n=1 Tax=Celeribacter sp. PS-C1 TaxID=2820813 RepID=UPI001CA5C1E7|nr:5,6-dimethylbenzimidazole synthase [Celeribacter sp. PS-C1]MBW6418855.1 5,6-dimethylbenzimidazole synthase [Celeribacter sp. PS-C1]